MMSHFHLRTLAAGETLWPTVSHDATEKGTGCEARTAPADPLA